MAERLYLVWVAWNDSDRVMTVSGRPAWSMTAATRPIPLKQAKKVAKSLKRGSPNVAPAKRVQVRLYNAKRDRPYLGGGNVWGEYE